MPQLDITLDSSNRLSVGDSNGQNSINPNPAPTIITFTLSGKIALANFVPMTAAQPGFSFAYPPGQLNGPPLNLFTPGVIGNNGNSLTMTDNHTGASTAGEWIYILRVVYNGTVYATSFQGAGGTTRNPVIINR